MQKIRIVQPGKRFNGLPLEVGAVVEMEEPRARDWIARGWASSPEQPFAGAKTAASVRRPAVPTDPKELRRLAKKHGIDPRGMSPEDLRAAVKLALEQEEAHGEQNEAAAREGGEGSAEASDETSGGEGDEEPA